MTARTSDNWTRAIARLNANGYHSVSVCLDACKMNIGVPQTRKRLFVVLCRTSGQDLTVAHKMNDWLEECKMMMRSRNVTSIEQAIPEMKDKTLFIFPRRRENQCVFASDRPAPCIRSMVLAKPTSEKPVCHSGRFVTFTSSRLFLSRALVSPERGSRQLCACAPPVAILAPRKAPRARPLPEAPAFASPDQQNEQSEAQEPPVEGTNEQSSPPTKRSRSIKIGPSQRARITRDDSK